MKKVAILQSNYIPWKGYFDIINSVDEFILYDDMQYTRRDWRNRNKIKTAQGLSWLTIPVDAKGKFFQKINETRICEADWPVKHWKALVHNYRRARFFSNYEEIFAELYHGCSDDSLLSQVNLKFIKIINKILGIKTKVLLSSEFDLAEGKSERLIALCKDTGAGKYLSGPAAMGYLDVDLFEHNGVMVEWMDYSGYPEYNQLYPPFEHGVTILDLIFNEGPNSIKFMKSFGKK